MAYISKAQSTRRTIDVSKRTQPIALNGVSVREHLYTAEVTMSVRLIRVIYEEDTSADAGVDIRIGKVGFPDYFAIFTSELSQSAGDVTTVTKFDNRQFLEAGETLTVECDGGKIGDGVAAVQVELEGYR